MNKITTYSITVTEHHLKDSIDIDASFVSSRGEGVKPSAYETFLKLAYLEFSHRLRLVEDDCKRNAKPEAAQQGPETPPTTSAAPELHTP